MDDQKYIQRCLELASKGGGRVSPNPFVGSVIVFENRIIGEGYHRGFGQSHAEVNAINSVKNKDLLSSSTIYVNLEPCSHFGKTPPCSDLIIENKIPKVVVCNLDPHEEVAGKGFEKLRKAGVEIVFDICKEEGEELNKRFFTSHKKNRPYIILKWARTKDGFIDQVRADNQKGVFWITKPETAIFTHQMRASEDSILVGSNTVKVDNPSLTCRHVHGTNPMRLVIDAESEINAGYKVLDDETKTVIFNPDRSLIEGSNEWVQLDFSDDLLNQILRELHSRNILSVIVEGGKETLQGFINSGLWDEAFVLESEREIESGLLGPQLKKGYKSKTNFNGDYIYQYKNEK